MDLRAIEQVLERHRDALMAVPGVVGTAIGVCDGQPCIRVFVTDGRTVDRSALPSALEGFPISVEGTEPFEARRGR